MLVLLVIFMITAPLMQGGVDVQLPVAEARPLEARSSLVVTLDRNGFIHVDGTRMTYREFRAAFKTLAEQRARRGVYLQADSMSRYADFVRIVAVMRNAGVTNIGVIAEPEVVK
jgi:biopolymer transport protein ExbD/biopolymer transport protein TolR